MIKIPVRNALSITNWTSPPDCHVTFDPPPSPPLTHNPLPYDVTPCYDLVLDLSFRMKWIYWKTRLFFIQFFVWNGVVLYLTFPDSVLYFLAIQREYCDNKYVLLGICFVVSGLEKGRLRNSLRDIVENIYRGLRRFIMNILLVM